MPQDEVERIAVGLGEHRCEKCGEDFRLVWIGYPPEPYGDVCGCPDEELEDARADKSEDFRARLQEQTP